MLIPTVINNFEMGVDNGLHCTNVNYREGYIKCDFVLSVEDCEIDSDNDQYNLVYKDEKETNKLIITIKNGKFEAETEGEANYDLLADNWEDLKKWGEF